MVVKFETGYIYVLSNTIDNAFYIGSTKNSLEKRFSYHMGSLEPNEDTKRTAEVYAHLDRLGWKNVEISLLEEVKVRSDFELKLYETKYMLPHMDSPDCLNSLIPIAVKDWIYTTISTFLNSPIEYSYYQYFHSGTMRKVFPELRKYCKPYNTVLESFTRIRKGKLLKQLRKVVPRVNKVAFKSIGTASTKTLPNKTVPISLSTKNPPPIKNTTSQPPPKKRGRPKKEVPTKEPPVVVPTQVPTAVPVSPVPTKKKVVVPIKKYEVTPLTAFVK